MYAPASPPVPACLGYIRIKFSLLEFDFPPALSLPKSRARDRNLRVLILITGVGERAGGKSNSGRENLQEHGQKRRAQVPGGS